MRARRAIGIVRVSRSSGRTGESFSSPQDQADRITALALEHGWQLTIPEPYEIDVSGDALLSDRPQLSRAVVAVQTGEADVIAGAHTERLWWNHETASQVIRLVEDANGEVWSADQGLLTRRSAADEFSGTVRTAADRLSRRQNTEKTAAAIQRAISRGVPPWPRVTAGYARQQDGTYAPHPRHAAPVRAAFEQRGAGATVATVRQHLAEHGIPLTYPGTVKLLKSRVVLGEIHFGTFTPNLAAHPAIVDRSTWQQVQRARVPSGRNARSERLLARLGVLVCGTCGSRLVVNTAISARGRRYPLYRCQNTDCPRKVTVAAGVAEDAVVDAVRAALEGVEGRASAERDAREAEDAAAGAQAALDAAIRAFGGLEDEPVALERLQELRDARDEARTRAEELRGLRSALVVSASDWDALSLQGRRALIRIVVARALVAPGRGAGRVTVELAQ